MPQRKSGRVLGLLSLLCFALPYLLYGIGLALFMYRPPGFGLWLALKLSELSGTVSLPAGVVLGVLAVRRGARVVGSIGTFLCAAVLVAGLAVAVVARVDEWRHPLHMAVAAKDPARIRRAIRSGADPNALDSADETALVQAARFGQIAEMTALLDGGADPNRKCPEEGCGPIHVAAQYGKLAPVELLLARGARVEVADGDGRRPLYIAAQTGGVPNEDARLRLLTVLLTAGADTNGPGPRGRRPLHEAAATANVRMADLLLRHGADPSVPDDAGTTPLHEAAAQPDAGGAASAGPIEMTQLLVRHHARVNARDGLRRTPLACAQTLQHAGVARVLRAAGGQL